MHPILNKMIWTIFPLTCLFSTVDDSFPESCQLFAIDAYETRPADQNWLFSPFSAFSCMSMAYAGSNHNTALELSTALHFSISQNVVGSNFHSLFDQLLHSPVQEGDFCLRIAQGVWSQKNFPLLDRFVDSMQSDFDARVESIDFSSGAVEKINSFIANITEQKIQNLLHPSDIDINTRMILANAIHFKGCWQNPFSFKNTSSEIFNSSDESCHTVKMMHQTLQFPYFEDDDLQAILMPFAKGSSAAVDPACLLILNKHPKEPFHLSNELLNLILGSLSLQSVHLSVPKFKFEQTVNLKNLLMQLGVRDAFTDRADFSGIDGRLDLCINKALQKCFFSFEENGVEAAAATAAIMNVTRINPQLHIPCTFNANRPFEFLLLDRNSKTCLIIGHVDNP